MRSSPQEVLCKKSANEICLTVARESAVPFETLRDSSAFSASDSHSSAFSTLTLTSSELPNTLVCYANFAIHSTSSTTGERPAEHLLVADIQRQAKSGDAPLGSCQVIEPACRATLIKLIDLAYEAEFHFPEWNAFYGTFTRRVLLDALGDALPNVSHKTFLQNVPLNVLRIALKYSTSRSQSNFGTH